MELKLDKNKSYAIALEGGGAKGAYQVGVWRALEEAGIRFQAVSGTSVGALNGVMMAMGELTQAEQLWRNIRFSQVMNVDDKVMRNIFTHNVSTQMLGRVVHQAKDIIKEGGFDVEPLRQLLAEVVDEQKVRESAINFYLVTYSLSDRKELDLDAKLLPPGQLSDMLLASAYLPAFKNEPIGGKRYTDGGVQDAVPINSLLSRGYRDIIVVRLFGFGREKPVRIPRDATVTTIAPKDKLGSLLNFSAEQSERLLRLGYFDGQRALYGLAGETYYIDRSWDEQQAYQILLELARSYTRSRGSEPSLRELHEQWLPALARDAGARQGDYYQLLIAYLELAATELSLPRFVIRSDQQLLEEIRVKVSSRQRSQLPRSLRWLG